MSMISYEFPACGVKVELTFFAKLESPDNVRATIKHEFYWSGSGVKGLQPFPNAKLVEDALAIGDNAFIAAMEADDKFRDEVFAMLPEIKALWEENLILEASRQETPAAAETQGIQPL